MFLCFLGVLDSAVKLLAQVDIKKVVAYCTIFEMNIILVNFFFFSYYSYLFFLYFSILHTLLSFFFFFLVDCIYKRYNNRCILGVNNLLNFYPNLSFFLIVGVLLFNGIPLTLKFNLELIFFEKLLNFNSVFFLMFILIQIFGIIFFSKIFFSILFFSTVQKNTVDLGMKEILIFCILIFFFFFLSFF
jgi:NADH:ubiquinone oxidoreductase subunit 4 (subunit M)